MYVLLIFHEVRPISKTRNQLYANYEKLKEV